MTKLELALKPWGEEQPPTFSESASAQGQTD